VLGAGERYLRRRGSIQSHQGWPVYSQALIYEAVKTALRRSQNAPSARTANLQCGALRHRFTSAPGTGLPQSRPPLRPRWPRRQSPAPRSENAYIGKKSQFRVRCPRAPLYLRPGHRFTSISAPASAPLPTSPKSSAEEQKRPIGKKSQFGVRCPRAPLYLRPGHRFAPISAPASAPLGTSPQSSAEERKRPIGKKSQFGVRCPRAPLCLRLGHRFTSAPGTGLSPLWHPLQPGWPHNMDWLVCTPHWPANAQRENDTENSRILQSWADDHGQESQRDRDVVLRQWDARRLRAWCAYRRVYSKWISPRNGTTKYTKHTKSSKRANLLSVFWSFVVVHRLWFR
jgi:hypothetical protein